MQVCLLFMCMYLVFSNSMVTREYLIYLLFRDFTGGTLGLAWVASASGASGGICEKYKTYAENINGINHKAKRSLNTGSFIFVYLNKYFL